MTTTLEILDVPAIAEMLGKSTTAVTYMFRRGQLPGKKCGRNWTATRQAVADYLAGKPPIDEAEVNRRAMLLMGIVFQKMGAAMIEEAKSA